MNVYNTISEINNTVLTVKKHDKSVGFVPTMGALHHGHLSLIHTALKQTDYVVCSIFVNPIQFNNPDDLQKYPRTLEKDLDMLENAGCHAVFVPHVNEMYPHGMPTLSFDFGYLGNVMEGKFRPGHFSGVAVVVSKLFNIVQPDIAFFGQKDFQQCLIIKKLVDNLSFPIKIVAVDTFREPDGLAYSSRNMRLSKEDRQIAPGLYKCLKNFHHQVIANGYTKAQENTFKKLQLMGFVPEYIECVDFYTGQLVNTFEPYKKYTVCAAAYLGEVRLIDNVIINT